MQVPQSPTSQLPLPPLLLLAAVLLAAVLDAELVEVPLAAVLVDALVDVPDEVVSSLSSLEVFFTVQAAPTAPAATTIKIERQVFILNLLQ